MQKLFNFRFDDLLIGAPFEYSETVDGTFGGAVYIYYSSGIHRARHENGNVFLKPIKVHSNEVYSQFGLAMTRLGNLDGDSNNYNGRIHSTFFCANKNLRSNCDEKRLFTDPITFESKSLKYSN